MRFSAKIIEWYDKNRRDLPWRNTKSPYKVWLSEIILQQTRVDQGLPYYNRFVEEFPDIKDLADASEEKVLKLWQGLGYYSRARNLHTTAKHIQYNLNGSFPDTYNEIVKLKGVGVYTASAIASFCHGESKAVVDGNVYRLLSRFFGISTPIDSGNGKKEFSELANELLNKKDPATHNQAIMEFGARMCVPKGPSCQQCPLQDSCVAHNERGVQNYPVKSKKVKQRQRFFNYLVINNPSLPDQFLFNKRIKGDIWTNLYDFPLIETEKNYETEQLLNLKEWKELISIPEPFILNVSETYKHVLSHQVIFARFIHLKTTVKEYNKIQQNYIPVFHEELPDYAVPKLIDSYLSKEILNGEQS